MRVSVCGRGGVCVKEKGREFEMYVCVLELICIRWD